MKRQKISVGSNEYCIDVMPNKEGVHYINEDFKDDVMHYIFSLNTIIRDYSDELKVKMAILCTGYKATATLDLMTRKVNDLNLLHESIRDGLHEGSTSSFDNQEFIIEDKDSIIEHLTIGMI